MLKVRYVSSFLDRSGYAAAARDYILAIQETGYVDLTLKAVSFEQEKTSHGEFHSKVDGLINKSLDFRVQIVHLTPENFPMHRLSTVYNIGYTVWETDRLPRAWADFCNQMDEIWVPSQWNVEVFKKNGVKVPVHCVPHTFAENKFLNDVDPEPISMDKFLFYSIFQWIERKAPSVLLKAYYSEFTRTDNVSLALKTYRLNTSDRERQFIREQIKNIKVSMNLSDYPPVILFGGTMTHEQIQALHKRGDCFVLPSRGEGFSLCHAEAMGYGKPTVCTNYGGILEFMNKDNSFLVDYQLTPCSGMLFSNYNATMTWADPDIMHLRRTMRWIYENQGEAKKVGLEGQKTILNDYSYKKIGKLIVDRLKDIQKREGL